MKKVKVLLALYGALRLKSDIKLDEKVRIRRIGILNNEEDFFKFVNWRVYGRTTCPYDWVIEFDYYYDEEDASEPYPALLIKNSYIEYGLRLFYKHDVGFAALLVNIDNPKKYFISNRMPSSVAFEAFDNSIEFSDFWSNYKNSYKKKPAAYEYFTNGLIHPNSIKSFFFCGSLESLFVPVGERQKLAFVLQGVEILGFDQIKKGLIEDLFKFRNVYIHADKEGQLSLIKSSLIKSRGKKYLSIWWEDCENLIRKILFEHVKKPW